MQPKVLFCHNVFFLSPFQVILINSQDVKLLHWVILKPKNHEQGKFLRFKGVANDLRDTVEKQQIRF